MTNTSDHEPAPGRRTRPAAAAEPPESRTVSAESGLTAEQVTDVVARVADALDAGDRDGAAAIVAPLVIADLARVIELLAPADRVALTEALGTGFPAELLSELDETVRDQIAEAIPNEVIARAVTELDTDDAAYVIEALEDADKEEVLAQIPSTERVALERALEYPEGSAGRLMQADFVAVPPFWTVGQVIDYMRESADLPETFSDIYVVDAAYRVVGSLDLSRLLRTKREIGVETIMDTERHLLLATADQETVARQFERYDLKSAPVVDENKRLVGVVTVDDVVEVIEQEAEEDIKALAGVGTPVVSPASVTSASPTACASSSSAESSG